MSKYSPLKNFLRQQHTTLVPLTFSEIERLIGSALPASARNHRAWWSNNPSNSVITEAWLKAGFRTEKVDMVRGELTFRRIESPSNNSAPSAASSSQPLDSVPVGRHPLFGALKGLLRIAPGTDLTQPADPDWGKDR